MMMRGMWIWDIVGVSFERSPYYCDRHTAHPFLLQNLSLRGGLQQQSTHHGQLDRTILRREIMRYTLLVLIIGLSLCGVAAADSIQATVKGMVCGFCATGIEKTFRAQPEVKAVDVDLENKLVTIQTKQGQTLDDSKIKKLLGNAGYSVVGIVRKKS
jgi:copper chaperone CopZ